MERTAPYRQFAKHADAGRQRGVTQASADQVRDAVATRNVLATQLDTADSTPAATPESEFEVLPQLEGVPPIGTGSTFAAPHPSDVIGPPVFADGPSDDGSVIEYSDCGGCGQDGCAACTAGPYSYKNLVRQGLGIDHLSIFGGVHGFTNESTRGEGASFGFHEGVNFGTFGRNIILPATCGAQIGFRAVHSNLSGASFTTFERNQFFLTTGIYRQADCGLQGGLVFDFLNDDWYFDDLGLGQLRGELSVAISDRNSYGFWFASSTNTDTKLSRIIGDNVTETWETVDQYAFFYRTSMLGAGRGEGRVYAGWSGNSDGIIGADSRLPLRNGWAVESRFSYLIPDEQTGAGGSENEAWNIGINLAWYPGSLSCGSCRRYHRPLFEVADNGSMIVGRR
jgi:hypothetical protein